MTRRRARERALQALFRLEFTSAAPDRGELEAFCKEEGSAQPGAFCIEIVLGTFKNIGAIDAAIKAVSEHWDLERMPAVDRNILRAGAYEILFRADIPPAVAINEAIEIAKKYSTADSASFINGILDKIAKSRKQ